LGRRLGNSGGRRRCLIAVEDREHGADRDLRALWHDEAVDRPALEDLDVDRALLRLDDGDDVAALDLISRLDQPLDERA
jgi:hypothetical protein